MPTVGVDLWPGAWGGLQAGIETRPGPSLFPRIDKDQEQALLERFGASAPDKAVTVRPGQVKAEPGGATQTGAEEPGKAGAKPAQKDIIAFEEFAKVDLRVARVISAESMPRSDKLLKLMVDIGEGQPRQIFAGIARHYRPEQMVGKQVIVVANLKPRQMMGAESRGMLLAASDAGALVLVSLDAAAAPGSTVS